MYKAANAPIIQPSNYSNVLLPGQPRLTALNRAQPRLSAVKYTAKRLATFPIFSCPFIYRAAKYHRKHTFMHSHKLLEKPGHRTSPLKFPPQIPQFDYGSQPLHTTAFSKQHLL